MLSHANVVATIETAHNAIPPQEHRLVSLLPLSHLMEQAIALFYALTVGADILYVRSRNPRVIFEAIRDHRVTTMLVVPQVLDLFWSAIEREVDKSGRRATFDRLRGIARHLPYGARRVLFRRVHAQLGGELNLFVCAAAFLPPSLQQAWEDVGVVVMQGYGATECGSGQCDVEDRPRPRDRRPDDPGSRSGWPTAARSSCAARRSSAAIGATRRRPPRRSPTTAGTEPATSAGSTTGGHLILMGRIKDIIVLPNGLNVYPEDIENALRVAGIRDSVVLETHPAGSRRSCWRPGPVVPARPPRTARSGRGRLRRPVRARTNAAVKRRTRPWRSASASRPGACGPRPTSRGRTPSRSSATRSGPGPWSSSRCRSIRSRSGRRPRASAAPGPA